MSLTDLQRITDWGELFYFKPGEMDRATKTGEAEVCIRYTNLKRLEQDLRAWIADNREFIEESENMIRIKAHFEEKEAELYGNAFRNWLAAYRAREERKRK